MANTYDTSGLPLGTTSPKALYNNVSNFDEWANGPLPRYPDRFGLLRLSIAGMENAFTTAQTARNNAFNTFLSNSGYESVHLVYVNGSPLNVQRPTQLIDRAGSSYRVKQPANFPVFLSGTWATDAPLLVEVADSSLRQDLAGSGGAGTVGFMPTGLGASQTTVQAALDKFDQKPTGQFYSAFGAKVNRVADRLFIGDAINHDGGITPDQPDWFTTYMRGKGREYAFVGSSTLAVTNSRNTDASNTALLASHTGDLYPGWNAIGLIAVGVGNNTGVNPSTGVAGHAYAIYAEAYRDVGVPGGAYGAELDVINYASLVGVDPYVQRTDQTIGLQLAAGGEFPSAGQADISAAINIRRNGSRFYRGIVFGNDSLTGTDGSGTGTAIAIALGRRHLIQWFCGTEQGGPSLFSSCSAAANSLYQEFGDNFMRIGNTGGGLAFEVESAANAVNHLSLKAQPAGLPAQILAKGTGPVDIQLVTLGGGVVWIGAYVPPAGGTPAYIPVRTDDGQLRRLALV